MRFNTLYNWQVIHKIEWRKWEEKMGITQHKKALSRNAKRQFNLVAEAGLEPTTFGL